MNNTNFAKNIKNLRKNRHPKPVSTKMNCIVYVLHLALCSYHVTYTFPSKSTFYNFLNVKELSARRKRDIWNLSDCSRTRINNHLVHKRTRNHLAKPAKWLSCVMSIYPYGAFDCISLSCHVRASEWIHTLWLPECQRTHCSKQERYPRFKWWQRDSNPQPLSS